MTIKTEINGQPFEIEIAEGINIEFSEGKINISKRSAFGQQWPTIPVLPALPSLNPNQQISPPTTWDTNGTIQHEWFGSAALSGQFPK